jgi:hypothetical protein
MQGGPRHGPYYARFWWQDGRRYKRYIRQGEAEKVAIACAVRRAGEGMARRESEVTFQQWREVRTLIREIERGQR